MPSQSSFQRGQSTFYAPTGTTQPVVITLDEIDERRAAYLAEDGPADQFRLFAEPRWLFEQSAARGAALAQHARRELLTGPLTPERARLYARLTAVQEQHTRLTQAQEDRVGHRVSLDGKDGLTVFAELHAGVWQYRVRLASGRTVSVPRGQLADLDGTLPADSLPPAAPEPPVLTSAGEVVYRQMVAALGARSGDPERIRSWAEGHHPALAALCNALAEMGAGSPFETTPPPAGQPNDLKLPDVPPPSKPATTREFKGHPVLVLGLENDKEWSFGLAKARSILANLEAIATFVAGDTTGAEPDAEPDAISETTGADGSPKA